MKSSTTSSRHDKYCKANGCKIISSCNADTNISFFRFPKDEKRCALWVELVGNKDLFGVNSLTLNASARLCSQHFTRDQFTNDNMNRLNRNALPSVNLLQPASTDNNASTPTVVGLPDNTDDSTELFYFSTAADVEVEVVSDPIEKVPTNSIASSSLDATFMPKAVSTPKVPRPTEELEVSDCTLKQPCVIEDSERSQPLPTTPETRTPTQFVSKQLSPGRRSAKKLLLKSKAKRCILKAVDVSRVSQLTPRKKKMHAMIVKANKRLAVLEQRCKEMKLGLRDMQSNLTSTFIQQIEDDISPAAARLFESQIRCGKKSTRGRRYSLQDKILAISLYKRSPKAYKLMQTFLALPAPRTLITILNKIPFLPGINEQTFKHLKDRVSKMDASDRVCSLLFDEVALSSGVFYSEKLDQIVGFEDYGSQGKTSSVANHALAFMVRGLRKKWKQPVAYFFCKDCTKTNVLCQLIHEVIVALQETGLHVLCAISDQGSTNRAALDSLVQKYPSAVQLPEHGKCFKVNDDDIAVMYDPPHLLKSLRNAFLKYDVVWTSSTTTVADDNIHIQARASWDHVKLFYRKDKETIFQRAPKLTEAHIDPNSNQKMRVKLAAQVFSQRVASGINSMIADPSLFGVTDANQHYMPSSAIYTSQFLSDVDQLFDSFNGTCIRPQELKMHRVCLRQQSIHKTFWPDMTKKINDWRFVDNKGKVHRSPFQNGWLTTIHGAALVGRTMREKYRIKVLQTRRLNTDPMENLFCLIRQHGQDNTNPSCTQFESALKTCIINGMMKSPSVGSNCVADSDDLLTNLQSFLQPSDTVPESVDTVSMFAGGPDSCDDEMEPFGRDDDVNEENEESDFNLESLDFTEVFPEMMDFVATNSTVQDEERSTVAYVCGYIIRKVIVSCECCKALLTTSEITGDHVLIDFRERSDKWRCLVYPTPQFVTSIGLAAQVAVDVLSRTGHELNVKERITSCIKKAVDFRWLNCPEHHSLLLERVLKLLCRVIIHHYCRKMNRTLKLRQNVSTSEATTGAAKPTQRQRRMKKVLHK